MFKREKPYYIGIGGGSGLSFRLCGYNKEYGFAEEKFDFGDIEDKNLTFDLLKQLKQINSFVGYWIFLGQEEEI